MSKLVLHDENGATREFALDRERITIGRKAHNDIHLDDSAVSGNHAVIITLGGDSFLEDLNSTNGTRVNQKDVHKCVLQDRDEIRIATYNFTFISEASAQSAPGRTISSSPKTGIAPPASARAMDAITVMPELTELHPSTTMGIPTQTGTFMAPTDPALRSGTPGIIRILSGPGAGQMLELSKPITTLGKPGIQVVAITLRDNQYYLGVIEGDELPLVNGAEIKGLPYLLQHQDVIDIAGTQLEFSLK